MGGSPADDGAAPPAAAQDGAGKAESTEAEAEAEALRRANSQLLERQRELERQGQQARQALTRWRLVSGILGLVVVVAAPAFMAMKASLFFRPNENSLSRPSLGHAAEELDQLGVDRLRRLHRQPMTAALQPLEHTQVIEVLLHVRLPVVAAAGVLRTVAYSSASKRLVQLRAWALPPGHRSPPPCPAGTLAVRLLPRRLAKRATHQRNIAGIANLRSCAQRLLSFWGGPHMRVAELTGGGLR